MEVQFVNTIIRNCICYSNQTALYVLYMFFIATFLYIYRAQVLAQNYAPTASTGK